MKARKFVGKKEIASLCKDPERIEFSLFNVCTVYDVFDDRFYSTHFETKNTHFWNLQDGEIPFYFSGSHSMKSIVSRVKRTLVEYEYNPDYVTKRGNTK